MNKQLLVLVLLIFTSITINSQDKPLEVKYRRSSLHTMIIESETFPKKDTVIKAFYEAPFPDKYNEHAVGEKSFNPSDYCLTKEEKKSYNIKDVDMMGGNGNGPLGGKIDTSSLAIELPFRIQKYLNTNRIANKMVAKWFNRQEDGTFDLSLISERGMYDASEMEANIAKSSARGTSALADAGVELIGNTFLVVNRFNFLSNEGPAAITRDIAKAAAKNLPSPFDQAAFVAADIAYNQAKNGYSVWATSYLYKLVWNDSTEAVFYTDLWMDKSNIKPARKEAFDSTDLFKLEFIGAEKATGLVLFTSSKSSEEQIIKTATIRTIDAVYAKLQKKYDVFMPKTTLFTGDPLTAKIGMKEGLEGGEKFEVFEQVQDPTTGRTKYISKGKITVDKKLIWDNRYNAGDQVSVPSESISTDSTTITNEATKSKLDRTTFKGGKNFYAGMLIKQVK